MVHQLLKRGVVRLAIDDVNIDSAGDNHEVIFGIPVRIRRVGFVVTTEVTNAAATVAVNLRRRPVAGADANHVELATFTLTGTDALPVGTVIYKDCYVADHDGEEPEDHDPNTSRAKRFEAPSSDITPAEPRFDPWIIPAGQSLELDVSAESDTGAVAGWIEYDELPLNGVWGLARSNVSRDLTDA